MSQKSQEFLRTSILNNIRPRLVAEQNIKKEQERDVFVEHFLDLGIAYQANIGGIPCTITKFMLKQAGIKTKGLQEVAIRNMEPEVEIQDMVSVISEGMFHEKNKIVEQETPPMYVVRAGQFFGKEEITNGAAAILSERVREKILGYIGESAYLLPCSTEEIIACPCRSMDPMSRKMEERELLDIIRTVNRSECINDPLFLSDNLYRLQKDGRITVITGKGGSVYESV